MENITLKSLIEEHKQRIKTLNKDPKYSFYYYDDLEDYQKWLAKTSRYIRIHYPNDKFISDFDQIANQYLHPEQQTALLAILKAFVDLPTVIPQDYNTKRGKGINVTTNINNSNTQSQNQEQNIAINLFLEAIKDDLTGKQVKELKAVLAESGNDKEKAREGLVEKLKSFGLDVSANIVANILTNPTIWSGFIN